jgi:ferric enterobactin receptor
MHARSLLSIATLLLFSSGVAVSQGSPPSGPTIAPTGQIRGKVLGGAGQPVPNASISVRHAKDTSYAGGTLPRPDGNFVVDGLKPGTYIVQVRAIGFSPVTRGNVAVTLKAPADLGTVTIQATATVLAQSVVLAERENVTLAPERNSYAVKSMASVSGGNAVDALRNVPSVEVDAASNTVSLRGNSNVVVQINGRTSPLRGDQLGTFLAQIPAATLTSIEVTTSPSAKEDPEGTAGIINIVLAQEVEGSRTAGLTFGTGTTRLATGSANAGFQNNKWTLFGSVSASNDPRSMTGTTERTNTGPVTSYTNSESAGENSPRSQSLIARTEYKPSKIWAVSLDAMANRSRQGQSILANFTDTDANADTTGQFESLTNMSGRNAVQDYSLALRRQGPKINPFSVEGRYTRVGFTTANLRVNNPGPGGAASTLVDSLDVRFPSMTLQSDYSRSFGKNGKFDVGAKASVREPASASKSLNLDGAVASTLRSASIDYQEVIGAAYGMGARQFGNAQVQLGLRMEHTGTRLELASRPEALTANYFSVFPNGALTYSIGASTQLRAGYSRRIARPQPGQLDPAERWETPQAVVRGNPDLKAEYTDALEFGFQRSTGWGSLQVNPYVRHTDNAMRLIRTVDENDVTVTTFANAATMRTIGADANANIRRGKLSLTLGGGMFDYRSEAGELSTHTVSGNARVNATLAPSKRWDAQMQMNYLAPQGVEGGTRLANFMSTFAARWKLNGDANVLTFRLTDPFYTMRMRVRTRTGAVTEDLERRFSVRGVFLTWSRTFGQQLKLRPKDDVDAASQMGGAPPQ